MSAWSAYRASAPSSSRRRKSSRRICGRSFPFDSRGAYGELGGFRDEYPGGVIHLFRYLVGHFSAMHQHKGPPGALPPEREKLWREAMNNPDYRMYPHVYNVIAQKGQHMPPYYNVLVDPFDSEAAVQEERSRIRRHQGADLYRLGLVRLHLQDPSQRLPALVSQYQGAEEALARRTGASGAAVSHFPQRGAALARSLAQRHRHRHHGRAAGALLGDGRQRMAHGERLAAAADAMDQALSEKLGAARARAAGAIERRRDAAAGRLRADAALADRAPSSACAT